MKFQEEEIPLPRYHSLGSVPAHPHTEHRVGGDLVYEEVIGTEGFGGPSSLLHRLHRPTGVTNISMNAREDLFGDGFSPVVQNRHFRTGGLPKGGNHILDRHVILANNDVRIAVATPNADCRHLYRNSCRDEVVFVAEGSGVLQSPFGLLEFRKGDFLVIPRSIIHRLLPEPGPHHYLILESRGSIDTPRRYRNDFGQHIEGSPISDRSIRIPRELPRDHEEGNRMVYVRVPDGLQTVTLAHSPFDVVGWDGCYYPWAFNIADFHPVVGQLHQPPTVHQVFEAAGFTVCVFVPRMLDFHPNAVTAPYNHTNVGSDEVIYYVSGNFTSRSGIEAGSITHHPDGMTHGPQPGRIEASIGAKETNEVAVMIDTFNPLRVTETFGIEDENYYKSWLES